jgi:hypothetical protein
MRRTLLGITMRRVSTMRPEVTRRPPTTLTLHMGTDLTPGTIPKRQRRHTQKSTARSNAVDYHEAVPGLPLALGVIEPQVLRRALLGGQRLPARSWLALDRRDGNRGRGHARNRFLVRGKMLTPRFCFFDHFRVSGWRTHSRGGNYGLSSEV